VATKSSPLTGKAESADYLRALGAAKVLLRKEIDYGKRPLEAAQYGGAIDNVGGEMLTWLTRTVDNWGNIASIGLAGGAELHTTVMPFILRGVNLIGINSSATLRDLRLVVWQRIATDLKPRSSRADGDAYHRLRRLTGCVRHLHARRYHGPHHRSHRTRMTDRNAEIRTLAQGASALGFAGRGERDRERLALTRRTRTLESRLQPHRYRCAQRNAHASFARQLVDHKILHGTRIIDVGTGAGFPGLPLAILAPDKEFTLLDSNGKKVRFVAHAARTLGLRNVVAIHARVEEHVPAAPFDTVLTRAFAPSPELLRKVAGLCGADTEMLAMKGRRAETAREGLPAGWRIDSDQPLSIPGLAEERHLLVLRRASDGSAALDSAP
jgi:16S rRNA (guanine(527)-N(7))-methyltransferase RsmG